MKHDAGADPIDELSHDHGSLVDLLFAFRVALGRVDTGEVTADAALHELRDAAEALRDELFEHFAREEEALFPFVVARIPALREVAERLHAEHDDICRGADGLVQSVPAEEAGALKACQASLSTFEELYARHSQSELAFLRDVAARLDEEARAELRRLLNTT